MKQLIQLPKIRKYDDRGNKMTKAEQIQDLTNRTLKLYENNRKKEAKKKENKDTGIKG